MKYRQLYRNDCGKCSIYNLLDLYNISVDKTEVTYNEQGTSIKEMENVLQKHFYQVDCVSFDIDELKGKKEVEPFIALISNNGVSHYIVINKLTKKHIHVIDSLYKKQYKMTYEYYKKITINKYIMVDKPKNTKTNIFKSNLLLLPLIETIESLLLLSTTIMIKQIIDNGKEDALLYIAIQIVIVLIGTYRAYMFLKTFRKIDKDIILKAHNNILNVSSKYIDIHDKKELFYRINDGYSYKNMILSFLFDMISDISMALFSLILMFIYSYILGIIMIIICSILAIISYYLFSKSKKLIEERRKDEYIFIDHIKKCLQDYENLNTNTKELSEKYLLNMQHSDYLYSKLSTIKGMILISFQSILTIVIIIVYFTSLYAYVSVGSLVALINLVSLVLSPILNICSSLPSFSNRYEIKQRLKELQDNIK